MDKLKLLGEEITSLEYDKERGVLYCSALILPIENQKVHSSLGDEVIINKSFANKMISVYNKNLKGRFILGKGKNAFIDIEHSQNILDSVGSLKNELRLSVISKEGALMEGVVADFIITEDSIVKDILRNGRNSIYSNVSIDLDLETHKLNGVTLCERPALKNAMLLSEDKQKFYNLEDSKKKQVLQLSEEIQDLKMGILANELRIQEIAKEQEISKELNLIIDNSFSQNQINREQAEDLKNSLKLSNLEEVKNIDKVLKSLPKNILNLSNRFGRY